MRLRIRTPAELAQAAEDAKRAAERPDKAERQRRTKRAARKARDEDYPERRRAREAVALAISLAQGSPGALRRPEHCSQCGKRCKPHAHHADYSKPLDVEWLCSACHGARHSS